MSGNNRMRVVVSGAIVASVLGSGLALAPSAEAATPATTAIKFAQAQLGERYSQVNPQGPNHWDCSGLVQASYKKAGKKLPRTAIEQYRSSKTKFVSAKSRKPGDLVFFGTKTSGTGDDHVGIYYGWKYKGKAGGWLLNANAGNYRGHKVVVAPIKEYGKVAGYKRVK
jgi:cell wall-associated NlpC family hydrolase